MLTFEPVRSRIMRQRDPSIDDLAVTAGVFGTAAPPAVSYAHTNALSARRCGDAAYQFRIDDHRHEVTSDVYELLTIVGERARHPPTIVLERDGAFPTSTELLADLRRTRHALEAGRAAQWAFA